MNAYDPNHPLQKAYDKTNVHCLCGHFESCAYCDGTMEKVQDAIIEAAIALNFQLYHQPFFGSRWDHKTQTMINPEPQPIDYDKINHDKKLSKS